MNAPPREKPENLSEPNIVFYRIFPDCPAPKRAEASMSGAMPLRAHRFCEPFTAACNFGWYLYAPIDLYFRWDGHVVWWKHDPKDEWMLLDKPAAFPHRYLPDFTDRNNRPPGVHPIVTIPFPFLIALPESGFVQIWTGLMVRTRPGWASLVRPPVNLPAPRGCNLLEGIVETDWWFGPLFGNIRLEKTDYPIRIRTQKPLFQLQVIPKDAYSDVCIENSVMHVGFEAFSQEDWQAYAASTLMRNSPNSKIGSYKSEVRRRLRAEYCPEKSDVERDTRQTEPLLSFEAPTARGEGVE